MAWRFGTEDSDTLSRFSILAINLAIASYFWVLAAVSAASDGVPEVIWVTPTTAKAQTRFEPLSISFERNHTHTR